VQVAEVLTNRECTRYQLLDLHHTHSFPLLYYVLGRESTTALPSTTNAAVLEGLLSSPTASRCSFALAEMRRRRASALSRVFSADTSIDDMMLEHKVRLLLLYRRFSGLRYFPSSSSLSGLVATSSSTVQFIVETKVQYSFHEVGRLNVPAKLRRFSFHCICGCILLYSSRYPGLSSRARRHPP
jgi:hypothetical protein